MRNLLIFMFLVGIFVLGSRSCNGFHWGFGGVKGEGPAQTEQRTVPSVHGVQLDMSADVELVIGSPGTMEISAQQNLISLIKTSEEGGVLRIYTEENYNTSEPIKIKLGVASLDEISLGGSGSVKVPQAFQADRLTVSIGGSGEVYFDQATLNILKSSISGSGELHLAGKCNDWNADISGSGEVFAKAFTSNTLQASISGSGSITADVTTELIANVSGSGEVYYSGSPSVKSSVSGSGSVEKVKVQ